MDKTNNAAQAVNATGLPVEKLRPPFRKAGRRPVYAESDLDAWALAKLGQLVRSTSAVIATQPYAGDEP